MSREHSPSKSKRCPECGTDFSMAGAAARKKVQCPKCRATVTLESAAPAAPKPSASPMESELIWLRAGIERIAKLEARISDLEARLSQPASPLPPAAEPVKLRWVHSDSAPETGPTPAFEAEREAALLHNLRVMPGQLIVIRSAAGDNDARRLAERFKAVFEKASWRVRGVEEIRLATVEHGIALAAATLPATREVTSTYLAFTAAGFSLESRLDPSLDWDEAVLTVA
jgi:hypothetical protein